MGGAGTEAGAGDAVVATKSTKREREERRIVKEKDMWPDGEAWQPLFRQERCNRVSKSERAGVGGRHFVAST